MIKSGRRDAAQRVVYLTPGGAERVRRKVAATGKMAWVAPAKCAKPGRSVAVKPTVPAKGPKPTKVAKTSKGPKAGAKPVAAKAPITAKVTKSRQRVGGRGVMQPKTFEDRLKELVSLCKTTSVYVKRELEKREGDTNVGNISQICCVDDCNKALSERTAKKNSVSSFSFGTEASQTPEKPIYAPEFIKQIFEELQALVSIDKSKMINPKEFGTKYSDPYTSQSNFKGMSPHEAIQLLEQVISLIDEENPNNPFGQAKLVRNFQKFELEDK
jgi:hypothetical protein